MTPAAVTRSHMLSMLHDIGFGVLATEQAGQPHTSLIAITSLDSGQRLLFATYRNTRKFSNLLHNKRVSVLMDGRDHTSQQTSDTRFVLSAVGRVQDIAATVYPAMLAAHVRHHPDLNLFTQAPDCVLLEVLVEAYQVVHGIDDVSWWPATALSTPG